MTTLPQIITVLTGLDQREHATLTQFGRVICEADLLPRGKRGRGAPDLTMEEATSPLLGIYCRASPMDAPETITRIRPFSRAGKGLTGIKHRVLDEIDAQGTYLDGVCCAMTHAPDLVDVLHKVEGTRPETVHTFMEWPEFQRWTADGRSGARFVGAVRHFSRSLTLQTQNREIVWQRSYAPSPKLLGLG